MRSSWDETWMAVALQIAQRGACERAQIGAVIVTERNRIVATGYNGPPAGLRQSCAKECPRNVMGKPGTDYANCISIHAEANALLFCDRNDRERGSIYVTEVPCWDCAKLIANSGLLRVVCFNPPGREYRNPEGSLRMIKDSGLLIVEMTLSAA